MAIGQNRENDTPIGGLPEFRGNLQGGNVFSVGQVPVYDGDKFVPGVNQVLVLGYGGLIDSLSVARIADGSIMDAWDAVMPLGDTPLQMTPDAVTGIITVDQDGVYDVQFQGNFVNLVNNQDYFFELIDGAGPTGVGANIVGSNNVSSQSTGFNIMIPGTVGGQIAISAANIGDNLFDVVSMTFTVTRIG